MLAYNEDYYKEPSEIIKNHVQLNPGTACYFDSILPMLFSIPEFCLIFEDTPDDIENEFYKDLANIKSNKTDQEIFYFIHYFKELIHYYKGGKNDNLIDSSRTIKYRQTINTIFLKFIDFPGNEIGIGNFVFKQNATDEVIIYLFDKMKELFLLEKNGKLFYPNKDTIQNFTKKILIFIEKTLYIQYDITLFLKKNENVIPPEYNLDYGFNPDQGLLLYYNEKLNEQKYSFSFINTELSKLTNITQDDLDRINNDERSKFKQLYKPNNYLFMYLKDRYNSDDYGGISFNISYKPAYNKYINILNIQYVLCGIICYYSRTGKSGHYNYISINNDIYTEYNEGKIQKLNFSEFMNKFNTKSLLLFYKLEKNKDEHIKYSSILSNNRDVYNNYINNLLCPGDIISCLKYVKQVKDTNVNYKKMLLIYKIIEISHSTVKIELEFSETINFYATDLKTLDIFKSEEYGKYTLNHSCTDSISNGNVILFHYIEIPKTENIPISNIFIDNDNLISDNNNIDVTNYIVINSIRPETPNTEPDSVFNKQEVLFPIDIWNTCKSVIQDIAGPIDSTGSASAATYAGGGRRFSRARQEYYKKKYMKYKNRYLSVKKK